MAFEIELVEGRLKSFLTQLQAEYGILNRIVYKNKNQHRRCSYFQYLLKVRRNLKLLDSVHPEEFLDSCFNVITGRKAKAKAHFLETLKKRKCDGGNFNFMERLMGVARLLSEMVEPILKTATEISTLLARTFFMGFSLMILAILGRIRVLVQQMLLDVVSVFNEISSLAQKKQSIKINQDGIEVFREYYPMIEEVITLECVWETDKFVLVEKSKRVDVVERGDSETDQSLKTTSIKYRSIGISLEDDEPEPMKNDAEESGLDNVSCAKRKRVDSPVKLSHETDQLDQDGNLGDAMPLVQNVSSVPCSSKLDSRPNKKVAFISVAKPAQTPVTNPALDRKSQMQNDTKNTLFSLFSDDPGSSLF